LHLEVKVKKIRKSWLNENFLYKYYIIKKNFKLNRARPKIQKLIKVQLYVT